MQAAPHAKQKQVRILTGRAVLLWLVAFFVVVFAVNAVLVRAAISTFGGVETTSSYKAGLQFGHEVAVVERQDALHWQVSGKLTRDGAGQAVLDVTARDADGAPARRFARGCTARASGRRSASITLFRSVRSLPACFTDRRRRSRGSGI